MLSAGAGLHPSADLDIRWCAPNVPLDLAADLAMMQHELVLWRQMWPNDAARALLAFHARQMAEYLLEASGFYG